MKRPPLAGELVQALGWLVLLVVAIELVADRGAPLALGLVAGVAALVVGRWLRTQR